MKARVKGWIKSVKTASGVREDGVFFQPLSGDQRSAD
jgi:hypothetical protein